MATFTQLLDDLAVIQKLADLPNQNDGLTASQLKAKFDEAPETVQDYINNTLIPELEKTTAESGASRIGVETISGLSGNDVQAVLESIKAYLDSNLGTINEKADKTYVDAQDANLQGQITSNDGDISSLQTVKADKSYVDSQDSNLQGQITSNDNDITNLQNNKANKSNVIEKDSTVAYTPTTQYHPANKKYVDETVTAVAVGNLPEDSVTNAYLGADVKVGSLALLNTDDKSDVTSAINEVHDEITNSFHADPVKYYGNVKTIDDFQDVSEWTAGAGALSQDTTNVKIGGGAIRVTSSNSGGTDYADKNGISLDLSKLNNGEASSVDDYISAVVYISDVALTNDIQIRFSDKSTFDSASELRCLFSSLVTGWNYLKVKKSAFSKDGATVDWDNIQSLRVSANINTGYATDYFTVQLLQLVKADPSGTYPNPFQEDFTINSGEWFVGEEFGKVVWKDLQQVSDRDALVSEKVYDDFIFTMTRANATAVGNIFGPVFVEDGGSSVIESYVLSDTLYLNATGAGSATIPFHVDFADEVTYVLKKRGTLLSLKAYKNGDLSTLKEIRLIATPFSGKPAIGSYTYKDVGILSASITEIAHAHHADIAEVAKGLTEQARCRVKNATQSIPNITATKLIFDSVLFDNRGHFNINASTRITAKEAGLYQISLCVGFASNATGFRWTYIKLNNSIDIVSDNRQAVNGLATICNLGTVYELKAGDYLEAVVYQSSGGALNVDANSYSAHFSIAKI